MASSSLLPRSWLSLVVIALGVFGCSCGGEPTPPTFVADKKLAFGSGSLQATAGSPVGPVLEVIVQDTSGNKVAGDTSPITLALDKAPASAQLEGTLTVNAVDGVARFTNVVIKKAGTGYVLRATSGELPAATSSAFEVVPAAASKLTFTQQPGNHSLSTTLGPVKVAISDAFDNTVAATSPSTAVELSPDSTALLGTKTVAPVAGEATFSDLKVSKEGTGFTLIASAAGLTSATSEAFDIQDDVAPSKPVLTQGDTTTTSIVVQWTAVGDDGNSGTAASQELRYSTSNITSDAEFAAATLVTTGAPKAAGAAESATLTGLSPSSNYYVALKVTDNSGNSVRSVTLPVSTTNPIVAQLAFVTQPQDAIAGETLAPVKVALLDASGNTVTSATSAVGLSVVNGSPLTAVNAVAGIATFSALSINTAGVDYRLEASSGSLPTKQSDTFDIRPAAAATIALEGVSTPTTAGVTGTVQVTVRDAFDNVATGYTGTVHFTSSDPQALLPMDTTFSPVEAGTATFPVELRTAGQQNVTVSGSGIAEPDTLAWGPIEAAAPDHLVFSVQPSNGSVRAPLAEVAVLLKDAFENDTLASDPAVTLGLSDGNVLATLSGTQNMNPSSGVAVFSDLSIDEEGTGFHLIAIASGLTEATSAPFTITDSLPPAQAVISASALSGSSARVSWTAVGDDDDLGTAASYDLRYASTPITTETEFAAATRFTIPAPQPPGNAESATVTGLNLAFDVYFALKVSDAAGNSSLSNSPKVAGDPCTGVTCTPPAGTCSANGRSAVTYTSACVVSSGVGVCQDTPTNTTCQSYETCSAGACVPVTAASQRGRIILSEFSSLGAEFIELRNTTGADFDVHGFTLRNAAGQEVDIRAITDPNGTAGTPVTVPANGVLYGIPNPSGAIPVGTGFVYGAPGTSFALADAGDALALYAPSGGALEDAVDFRAFHTNPNTPMTASDFVGFAGSSTQLDDTVLTAADNDTATNWCVSFYGHNVRGSRITHTMGALNGSCKVAVINEVLADPPGGDDGLGFMEIAGPGGSVIGGATITDIEGKGTGAGTANPFGSFTLPAGVRIPADGILLIADLYNSGLTGIPTYIPGVDVGNKALDFENLGGDAYQLISATGQLLDALGHDVTGANLDVAVATSNGLAIYETGTALYPESGTVAPSLARSPSSADTNNNRNDFQGDPSPTPGLPNDAVNLTVASMLPDDGPATAGANVTLTGTDFATGMTARFGNNGALLCVLQSSTQATCPTVANAGAVVSKVDVTLTNPAPIKVPNAVVVGGFTYTGTENETNNPNEADYCNLQFPSTFTVTKSTQTPLIYGQLYEAGITEPAGAPFGWLAEVGYGAAGSNPTSSNTWRFFPASYNVQASNNDEFMGSFMAPSVTVLTNYAYTYRFSADNGLRWTYCDLNGAGSNSSPTDLVFESSQLGVMTVTP
ncbi:IPT/TIG domain-containing protein [Hyalangium versicolor]|uniref:IPT/TIG domain-containing protein n=1 Tax=Hyalangium versicolor TaxID=2861190 RepID=UPI001CCD2C1A|nr:IPT/TIG domain-containing protein [Hyalangium versicolor]